MDTQADPLCVCTHLSSFSNARTPVNQSHPSTFKKTNAVVSSEKEKDLGHIVPLKDTVSHIAGSIIGGSISTISPSAEGIHPIFCKFCMPLILRHQGSSPAIISPDVYILPKRSRSCNGRVETPATVTRYIQESGAQRPRGANISWANDLREWDIDGHPSDWKPHKTPDLPQSGPDDGRSVEKDDFEPSRKTLGSKIYRTQDQSTQTEPIPALLGVPPLFESIDQPCISISSSPTLIGTKGIQKEEEDFWAPRSKRRRQDTEDVKPVLYPRYVVGDADGSSHRVSSSFDATGRSLSEDFAFNVNIRCIEYLGLGFYFGNPQYDSPTRVNAYRSQDRNDGEVIPRPGLKRYPASAPNSVGRSEDLSQVSISASPSASALDRFNKIVANCDSKKPLPNIDAMKRFQDAPAWCLANTAKGSRCNNRIAAEKQQEIKQLLTQLAEMNIQTNAPKCVIDGLRKLIDLAICHNQCKDLHEGVDQLVLPEPPKDSANPSDGPIPENNIPKFKFEEVPDPPRMSEGSRTFDGHGVHAVDTSWCRKSPTWALRYLPDYRRYYKSQSSYESNVENWVMKQAATPLTDPEVDEGYLYVYWNQATFGVRKIGYTSIDVSGRLKSWESKCKHVAEEQYRSSSIVRNAKRLERLVHAELKAYRVKEYGCHGCSRNHEEWFEGVDFDIIRESIDFWTEWIMEGQYENVNGKWFLKKDAGKKLQQVFKLCNRISVANAREGEEKSTTISPPRYNLRPRSETRSPSRKSRGS